MPNLSAHLGMAKEAASRLKHPTVDRYLGAFLLGSVSPDIRIMTRGKRDDTHFVDLDFQREGEGLDGLFLHHPHLAQAADLTEATQAFIVGYASHLFADELWILDMYRPYFGNREVFQDPLWGDLMDRALQLELDRREQLALGGLETLHPLMANAEEDVDAELEQLMERFPDQEREQMREYYLANGGRERTAVSLHERRAIEVLMEEILETGERVEPESGISREKPTLEEEADEE